MAKAGYCAQCGANVWLKDDGGCINGHDASQVSNAYEADMPAHQAAASQSSEQVDQVVNDLGQGLNEAGQQIGDFAKQAWSWGKKQTASTQATGGDSAPAAPPSDPGPGPDGQ